MPICIHKILVVHETQIPLCHHGLWSITRGLLTSSTLEQTTSWGINYQPRDDMVDTVSNGMSTVLNINGAESGMDHSLQTEYSKEESKDIVGSEQQKDVDAGTPLQRNHPMKLAKDHGQPSNSTTYIQVLHTLPNRK